MFYFTSHVTHSSDGIRSKHVPLSAALFFTLKSRTPVSRAINPNDSRSLILLPREEAILHTESQIMITDSLDHSQEVSASSHFTLRIWWQQQRCLMGKKGEEHLCPWGCCPLLVPGHWAVPGTGQN